ncbi:hypothetical protein ACROYT_G032894 [Oculina patagonica]
MIRNALIQGASRGIGLQMCRYLLAKQTSVIATCRDPARAQELSLLKCEHGDRLTIHRLDVKDEKQMEEVASHVGETKLDLLVNCAGMLHPSGKGETSLREVDLQGLKATLATNALGPLMMAKHFGPNLTKKNKSSANDVAGILVNISARVGSITDNSLGGWYSYRMSKAALNMATKNLSIELGRKRVICVSLHPGTVDTDLSRRYHRNVDPAKIFTPEFSVDCLMKIIDGLEMTDNGKFFAWDGSEIPW